MPHSHSVLDARRALGNILVAFLVLLGVLAAQTAEAPVAGATPVPAPAVAPSVGSAYTVSGLRTVFTRRAHLSSSTRRRAARYALAQIGDWYCYGGSGPSCFDCSGLVQAAYRSAGKYLPHGSVYLGSSRYTYRVSRSRAWMGDVAWRPGHVGFVLGRYGGRVWMVVARHTGTRITIQPVPSTMQIRRVRL